MPIELDRRISTSQLHVGAMGSLNVGAMGSLHLPAV